MAQELRHRWSIEHNLLSGITFGRWLSVLRDNHFAVDATYLHRALFLTGVSIFNSACACVERIRYEKRIREATPAQPVFILGHWRSGTTHLHNLLAQDTGSFSYPNTYQVLSPESFLTTESINSRLFARLIPATRPMDNMALSFQSPQEDEIALCLLSERSLYLGVSFPRRNDHYLRFLSFREADPADVEAWKGALKYFAAKLSLRSPKPLLMKSPPHTARIRHILSAFPGARFIHIHRHPYEVFRSSQHYFDTAAWYIYLQRPDRSLVDKQILERGKVLFDAFFEDLPLIPPGQFSEVSFQELEDAPHETLKRVYSELALPGFSEFAPHLDAYLASIRNYEKNRFDTLTESQRQQVAEHWPRNFTEWNYER